MISIPPRNGAPDSAGHQARVLIVDDVREHRNLLEAILSPEGFHILTAAGGEEALAIVAEQPPDLILLDLMMPGMDGYEVLGRLKGNVSTQNIPVIIITSLDDRGSRMRGLNAGAQDVLTKPVDRAELHVRAKNLLRLKAYDDYHSGYIKTLEGEVHSRTAGQRVADERVRFALEAACVGIWDMDYATGVLVWSEMLEAQYGFSPGTFHGTFEEFFNRVHPDDRESVRATIENAGRTGSDFSLKHRVIWPDGTLRWLSGAGRVILGKHGEPIRGVGISLDITVRRSLEERSHQAQKMESIGLLASGVAHDFNNLLTVILGFAGVVAADAPATSEVGKGLGEIINAANRATGLTKQLLAFSREQVLNPVPLDLNHLIAEMTGMLARLIGEQIEITQALAPDLRFALADGGQMEQVVMNLVINARDAMPDGGRVTIQTAGVVLEDSSLLDETIVPGHYVMLAISDAGDGMTEETQRRLFEPFYSTKGIGKGTGLGLSTTYGIVKQSKGYIRVFSKLGRGTTFKVYLPCADNGLSPPPRFA